MTKKYTLKFDIEIPVMAVPEIKRQDYIMRSILKYRCFNCNYPLKRNGIRNRIICPYCGSDNHLK